MRRSIVSFTVAMILAGTIGVFVTQSHLDSLTAVFFRCLIAALCLGVYGLYKGLFNRAVFRSGELRYIVIAGIALVINWVFIFQAFRLSSITIGIASYYTEPFFLIGLGIVLLKEKFSRSTVMWTALAFVGLLLIIMNNQPSASTGSSTNSNRSRPGANHRTTKLSPLQHQSSSSSELFMTRNPRAKHLEPTEPLGGCTWGSWYLSGW